MNSFVRRVKRVLTLLSLLVALWSGVSFAQDPSEPAADVSEAAADVSYRIAVNFELNSLELTPFSSAALDSVSALFVRDKRLRYEVHGYTCHDAGGQGGAMRLSAQRVERMVNHLISIGVPGGNIITVVNAPKSVGASSGGCTDDRKVDIMAVARWRDQEPVAHAQPEPIAPIAPAAPVAPIEPVTAAPEPPALKPVAAESGKQIVAVYMAGQEPQGAHGVHNIIGGELARVMSESDKYTAVDRTEAILEQLDREHVYQRSGAVDDDQIKAIGHQLGVQYLCISNINPVGKRFYLDTRLVDIVTAEIIRSVTATSTLKDANEMTRVGRDIALELLEADRTRERKARRKAIFRNVAIGLDALGTLALVYGYIENNNVVKFVEQIDGPEATRAATRRNAAYIVGGALLASGVSIHIIF